MPPIECDSAGSMVAGSLQMWYMIAGIMLAGCRTQLRFDDHESALSDIDNDIGQANTLLMILYLFYDI